MSKGKPIDPFKTIRGKKITYPFTVRLEIPFYQSLIEIAEAQGRPLAKVARDFINVGYEQYLKNDENNT